MVGVSRSYVSVIINISFFPCFFKFCTRIVAMLFGRNSFLVSGFLNFYTMFIRTRKEKYVFPSLFKMSCYNVGCNFFVCMPDMRKSVYIINCGSYIKSFFLINKLKNLLIILVCYFQSDFFQRFQDNLCKVPESVHKLWQQLPAQKLPRLFLSILRL